MTKYEIVDGHIRKNPYSDLVSNKVLFLNKYNEQEIIKLKSDTEIKWIGKDNSDYSNYPTFEEVIADYSKNPEKYNNKSVICRVKDWHIFTSDKTKGGYDRAMETSDDKCRANLKQEINGTGEQKGFNDDDAGTLNGFVRFKGNKVTLVKNMGNHRLWMKLLTNIDKDVEALMKIKFHKGELSQEDYIKIESDGHHTDASDRQSQNEDQKFFSGLRARRPEFLYCYEYLQDNKLDYKNVMNETNWLKISSISGFNKGDGYGIFSTYGEDNVRAAIGVARKVAKITNEKVIPNSAIWCFASMFKTFTEVKGDNKIKSNYSLFDKQQLHTFFIEFFTLHNSDTSSKIKWHKKKTIKLSDLTQSQGVKDFNFICASIFWTDNAIVDYHREIKDRKNKFTINHPQMVYFINKMQNILRKPARGLITGDE